MSQPTGVATRGPRSDGAGARAQPPSGTALRSPLSLRAEEHADLLGFLGFGLLAAVVYLLTTSPDPTPFDYFVRLADAFLHGRWWLTEAPSWLNELVPLDGRWYVVYPPMPAILLVPIVALFGTGVAQQVVASILGGVAVGFAWILVRRVGARGSTAAALTLVYAFGTVLWWASTTGSAWVLGHVTALVFLTPALILALDRRRPLLAGLLLGAAMLGRLPVVLALPFLAACYAGVPWPPRLGDLGDPTWLRPAIRRLLPLGAGLGALVVVYFGYNIARWGTFVDHGYTLIPGVLEDPLYVKHGIFALEYIPRHLYAILLRSWNWVDDPPFLQPSWWGLGLFLTTPLLAWIGRARWSDPRVGWAGVAIGAILIPLVTHGNVGIAQFGYRFSLDLQPLLFLVVAIAVGPRMSRPAWLAAWASIAICAYATWAIAIGFVAY